MEYYFLTYYLIYLKTLFIVLLLYYFICNTKNNRKNNTISIEAGIGVGKTTLLNLLREKDSKYNIILEPLEDWISIYRDNVNNNILSLLYNDMDRWAYTFQSNAFITRIQKIKNEKKSNKINITERSILSDFYIFAKMLYDDGKMNQIEWKLYNNWFKWLSNTFNENPSKIVYLRCDPQISFDRIHKRNRNEEKQISYEYIEKLHRYHDDWLLNKTNDNNIPVIVIDVSVDFENNPVELKRIMKIISNVC